MEGAAAAPRSPETLKKATAAIDTLAQEGFITASEAAAEAAALRAALSAESSAEGRGTGVCALGWVSRTLIGPLRTLPGRFQDHSGR